MNGVTSDIPKGLFWRIKDGSSNKGAFISSGLITFLLAGIIITAISPSLILVPTTFFFLLCVRMMYILGREFHKDFKLDGIFATDSDIELLAIYTCGFICFIVLMYFSHDICAGISHALRIALISLPQVINTSFFKINDLLISFFKHAFTGST